MALLLHASNMTIVHLQKACIVCKHSLIVEVLTPKLALVDHVLLAGLHHFGTGKHRIDLAKQYLHTHIHWFKYCLMSAPCILNATFQTLGLDYKRVPFSLTAYPRMKPITPYFVAEYTGANGDVRNPKWARNQPYCRKNFCATVNATITVVKSIHYSE